MVIYNEKYCLHFIFNIFLVGIVYGQCSKSNV